LLNRPWPSRELFTKAVKPSAVRITTVGTPRRTASILAERIRAASSRVVPRSWLRLIIPRNAGRPSVARMPIKAMTTMASIREKPALRARRPFFVMVILLKAIRMPSLRPVGR
jgi:hypothetical protein